MLRNRNLPKFCLFIIAVAIFFSAGSATAVEERRQGGDALLNFYHGIEAKLEKNSFGAPLYLESSDKGGRVHVDVYGVVGHDFNSVLNALNFPANWCDIASLHPDVKSCSYKGHPDTLLLTVYSGRKGWQAPETTYQFNYRYRNVEQRHGYLNIALSDDEGPFGTKDHMLLFEAVPLNSGSTFIHVSYAYSSNFLLRFAGKIYFATLGQGKIGFTVIGTDDNGNPIYIGGPRGAIERNAVRYYFAVQSFLDTFQYPEESRFSMRLCAWYDLTNHFRKQLFEMDKKDYLAFKTAEHNNQVMLQKRILTSLR